MPLVGDTEHHCSKCKGNKCDEDATREIKKERDEKAKKDAEERKKEENEWFERSGKERKPRAKHGKKGD
ncbi:hypothetical protein LTR85_012025 [Meristemomyces frigidus]|nr:hypothetical protein LTR85_012025 [Meristemomyces frigidus]